MDTIRMELGSSLHSYGHSSGDTDFYEVDVAFPGTLTLDVAVPAGAAAEPKLAFLGLDCRGDWGEEVLLIQRYVSGMVLLIEAPGTYTFAVAAQDPLLSLPEYKVRIGYMHTPDEGPIVGRSFRNGVAEYEPDPDPEGVAEYEPDPDPEGVVTSVAQDLPSTAAQAHSTLSTTFEVCRGDEVDDHGDIFLCATSLDLGVAVTGTLDSSWGDDDYFSFVLTDQRTVRIATRDGTDTVGVLYDRHGHRLAVDDDSGAGSGFRIVKTLNPGEYFVRVAGMDGAEGNYTLTASALSW